MVGATSPLHSLCVEKAKQKRMLVQSPDNINREGKVQVVAGYEQNWREYKRLRNTFLLVFLSCMPVFWLVAVFSRKFFHTTTPASVVAVVWLALFIFCGVRFELWRCPRCGEWFSGAWWYNKSFLARRCVHCGLPKYQP